MKGVMTHKEKFYTGLQHLKLYKEQHGDVLVGRNYVCSDGFKLGEWVSNKRRVNREWALPDYQEAELKNLGFIFDMREYTWLKKYEELRAYLNAGVSLKSLTAVADGTGAELYWWYIREHSKYSKGIMLEEYEEIFGELCSLVKNNRTYEKQSRT